MMKSKVLALCMTGLIALTIVGCGDKNESKSSDTAKPDETVEVAKDAATKTVSYDGINIEVADSWEVKDAKDGKYAYPEFGGLVYVNSQETEYEKSSASDAYAEVVAGMEESGELKTVGNPKEFKIGESIAYRANCDFVLRDKNYKGAVEVIMCDGRAYSATFVVPEAIYEANKDDIETVLDSITLDKATAPVFPKATDKGDATKSEEKAAEDKETKSTENETPTKSEDKTDATSASQKNALAKAKDYLSYTAFSHDGLVEQLEFEKFSHEDAVYGADNCGANWNEQAEKKAKDYLSYTAFSHDGLVEQLEFEKFTHDEAVYGADNCGADWNEQAAKKAKDYLSYTAFSHDGLVEQLEFEKFTHDEAEYGATEAGL